MKTQTRNKLIMGSAIGLAAVAVAIDHTRHSLSEAQSSDIIIIEESDEQSPCSLGNPCALGGDQESNFIIQDDQATNPCSLGSDSPCSL